MSASILKKALSICDPDLQQSAKSKKKNKKEKLKARVTKISKDHIIKSERKINVTEARERLKAQQKSREENLALLKKKKKAYTIKLKEDITQQIIERAQTRKPVRSKPKDIPEEKTVFTEEDFKKFEEEYIVE